MSQGTINCPVCGQPKSASTSGSFTQWVSICQCGLGEPQQPQERVNICGLCGKQVAEISKGSFTQWVFRSQLCECPRPLLVDALRATSKVTQDVSSERLPSASINELTIETFPLDRYTPIRPLGAGAGGSVYLCWDQHLSKEVSVKVLVHRSQKTLIAFQQEARVTAKFRHPNVVSIIDFGATESGSPFMVLEFIDGIGLDAIIRNEGRVPEKVAVELFIQIADALQHGHESGVFHRDVKCSNILVSKLAHGDKVGQVRIIDFGVAALMGNDQESTAFQGKTVVGTPKYMSPDQALGKPYDARSEIYSFGCVMFQCLIGRVPFVADTAVDLLAKHTYEPAPSFHDVRPDIFISEELEAIVLKCLEKDPEDRFDSMLSLKEALRRFIQEASSDKREGSEKQEAFQPKVSGDIKVLIAIVVALASLIPVAVVMLQGNSSDTTRKVKTKKTHMELTDDVSLPVLDGTNEEGSFDFIQIPGSAPNKKLLQAMRKGFVSDDDLAQLKDREDIRAVNLHQSGVEGPGLKHIVNLHIQALDLNGTPITDEGLDYVAQMKELDFLALEDCQISDEGLKKIMSLPSLRRLQLGNTRVSKDALKDLAKIRTLQVLQLENAESLDTEVLIALQSLPNLKRLSVTIDDKPLEFFQELGKFKSTVIQLNGKTPLRMKHLSYVDVYGLAIHFIPIYGFHLETLKSMKNLKGLEFDGAGITDAAVPKLIDIPIRELVLMAEPISNDGLFLLQNKKSLKKLNVQGCLNVTPTALVEFQHNRPDVQLDNGGAQEMEGPGR